MIRSESLAKFLPAFRKMQEQLKPVVKDAANPFFKSKYADLAAVYGEVQPVANGAGLSITQATAIHESGAMIVNTVLWHDSGEYLGGEIMLTPVADKGDKISPQAIGSAITYARRYGLMALLALPADDDDGNAGSGRGTPPSAPATPIKGAPKDKPRGKAAKDKDPDPPDPPNQYTGKPNGDITQAQVDELTKLAKQGNWSEVMISARVECSGYAQMSKEQAADLIGRMTNALGGMS